MDLIRILFSRTAAMFGRRRRDAALDDELRSHIDLATHENVRRGMSSEEARRAALRAFGGVAQTRETYRLARDFAFLELLLQDLRYGARQLRRSPAFTITAVLTLALGIGANAAVFSVLNALLFRPLPFGNANRLVRIYSLEHNLPIGPSPLDVRDFALQNHTFEKLAVFDQWRKNVITSPAGDNPEEVHVGLGPRELFEALGVQPILGRLFTADEGTVGRNHVAMIAESFWQSHFARDPAILGRTIAINNVPYTIVGVLPQSLPGWFRGTDADLEVWEPFLPSPEIWNEGQRGGRNFTAIGLLKKGVTVVEAEADLRTIAANLASAYPIDRNIGVAVQPLIVSRAGDLRPQLYLLMGAVTLILFIACCNLAALLLARNSARSREFAMRAALGARRRVLVRQIFVEQLLVSFAGGACGVALAWAIDLVIRHAHVEGISQLSSLSLDWRVLLFTFLIAAGTSLLFGLAPAVVSTNINVSESLKEGARGSSAPMRHWFRKALVIGQIALSLMLTVSAALFVQTILRLVNQDMGFRVDHLIKAHFFLPDQQYPTSDEKTRFCDQFAQRIRALPGVRNVSVTTIYPPYERWDMLFTIEGHPVSRAEDVPSTFFGVTDASYLKTAGITLLRGRDFSDADRENTPAVAIANQTFVNRFLPHEDPIGKRLSLGAPPNVPIVSPWIQGHNVPVTIVGVMMDSKDNGLDQPVAPQLITLFRQVPDVNYGFKEVVVRTDMVPQSLAQSLAEQLHSINPRLPLSEVQPMNVYIQQLTTDKRLTSNILSAFAFLGLLLAVVGTYGVISYLTAQRTSELAIRLALGADRRNLRWLILRQGIGLAGAGVGVGVAGIALAGRSLDSVLYGVSALDLVTLMLASALLFGVAIAASAVPARRAASINPMRALRSE